MDCAAGVDRHLGMWCGCSLLDCCHDENGRTFNCGRSRDRHVHSGRVAATFDWLLGANLRAVRMALRLSLAEVTELSGGRINGMTLASYERGERAVDPERLAELAGFYGTDAGELIPPVVVSV